MTYYHTTGDPHKTLHDGWLWVWTVADERSYRAACAIELFRSLPWWKRLWYWVVSI